jgi:hypothetical protein
MDKQRIILLDEGFIKHKAIFSYIAQLKENREKLIQSENVSEEVARRMLEIKMRNNLIFIPKPTLTFMRMVVGYLKRLNVTSDDKIILAIDFGSWRKKLDEKYKQQRKGKREEKESNDFWMGIYKEFNNLYERIDPYINWNLCRRYLVESDDWAAVTAKVFTDKEIILCLEGKTKIKLKNGKSKYIRNIVKGDEVLSYNINDKTYTSSKVLNKWEVKKEKAVRIYLNKNKGYSIQCGENHLFYTQRGWVKAKKLLTTDIIQYNKENYNRWKHNSVLKFKQPMNNKENIYRFGYLFGAYTGDGYIHKKSKSIHIEVNDYDFLERIKMYWRDLYNYNANITDSTNGYYSLTMSSSLIFDKYQEQINRLKNSRPFKKGFLAGFFDAEGNMSETNGRLSIHINNTNLKLLKNIQIYLKELDINKGNIVKTSDAKIREIKGKNYKCKKIFRLNIYQTYQVLKFFNDCKPAIKRKYPKWNYHINFLSNGKRIKKIETIRCKYSSFRFHELELEKPHTYFANGLLCHNCSSDQDWQMLCAYENVKIFSPITKKFKEVKNPLGVLASKINGDISDNLLSAPSSEREFSIRNKIVNLLELPEEIEKPLKEELLNLPLKNLYVEKLPYKSVREELKKLYT